MHENRLGEGAGERESNGKHATRRRTIWTLGESAGIYFPPGTADELGANWILDHCKHRENDHHIRFST